MTGRVPPDGTSAPVERVKESSESLVRLWSEALSEVRTTRGGVAFLESVEWDEHSLFELVYEGSAWSSDERDLLIVRHHIIVGVYVTRALRRQGRARNLVSTVIERESPRDAYALPGDRATKSLYEAFGWKARLLTMRAE